MTVQATEKKSYKDYLLSTNALYAGAAVTGGGLQALGMFTNNLGLLNAISNQILAVFQSMVNAVAGSFLGAAASNIVAQTLAIAAVAAVVTALAYACVYGYNYFTSKAAPAATTQQKDQTADTSESAPSAQLKA